MSGIHFSSPLHAAASAVGAFPSDPVHGRAYGTRGTPAVSVLLSGGFHVAALALFLLISARSRDEAVRLILTPASVSPPLVIRTVPPSITRGGAPTTPPRDGTVEPVPPAIPLDPGEPWTMAPVDGGSPSTGTPEDRVTNRSAPPANGPAPPTDPNTIQPYDEPPVPTYSPDPPYPEIARSAGIEGLVRLEAVVNQEGRVLAVEVKDGNMILADSAQRTVLTWKFRPGKRKGVPVTTRVAIPVRFTLRD